MAFHNSWPGAIGPSYTSSIFAEVRNGIGKYALNPRRLLTRLVLTSSRSPAGSQKKSTSGQSTLGDVSPSQYAFSSRSRLSFRVSGMAKWIIVITAGPLISATTTCLDELNRAVSEFSIQSAFSARVRPASSLRQILHPRQFARPRRQAQHHHLHHQTPRHHGKPPYRKPGFAVARRDMETPLLA